MPYFYFSAMRSKSDDSGSKHIGRSASVSESSRPVSMTSRRHNNSVTEKHGWSLFIVGVSALSVL